jgi:hypothetical protein
MTMAKEKAPKRFLMVESHRAPTDGGYVEYLKGNLYALDAATATEFIAAGKAHDGEELPPAPEPPAAVEEPATDATTAAQ